MEEQTYGQKVAKLTPEDAGQVLDVKTKFAALVDIFNAIRSDNQEDPSKKELVRRMTIAIEQSRSACHWAVLGLDLV